VQEPNIKVRFGVGRGDHALAVGAEAARQAVTGLDGLSLSAVLVFASVRYDLEVLLQGIHSVTGEAIVLEATTAGEMCSASRQGTVLVVALASPHLSVWVRGGRAYMQSLAKGGLPAVGALR
jgi:hypothetical protein